MARSLLYLFLLLLVISCNPHGESLSLEIDEEGIDAYIAEKLDTSQIYDITTGMRFSKADGYAYTPVRFSQNDPAILYTEQIEEANGITYRSLFFKQGLPVFVEEHTMKIEPGFTSYIHRKVYLNGAIILKALEKTALSEEELETTPFKEITMTRNQFDFKRAEEAINQTGDYEMKFDEFLVVDPVSYLVLKNEQSGYSVALLLMQGDETLNLLYENQEKYRGKTIVAYHEFMDFGGMQQMVYTAAQIVE